MLQFIYVRMYMYIRYWKLVTVWCMCFVWLIHGLSNICCKVVASSMLQGMVAFNIETTTHLSRIMKDCPAALRFPGYPGIYICHVRTVLESSDTSGYPVIFQYVLQEIARPHKVIPGYARMSHHTQPKFSTTLGYRRIIIPDMYISYIQPCRIAYHTVCIECT